MRGSRDRDDGAHRGAQDQTVYNPVNTTIFFIMVVTVILIGVFTRPPADEVVAYVPKEEPVTAVEAEEEAGERTFADRMSESRILMLIIGVAGIAVIVDSIVTKGVMKSLDFNFVIFLFLTLNAFLYNTPRRFVAAFKDMMRPAAEVMLRSRSTAGSWA